MPRPNFDLQLIMAAKLRYSLWKAPSEPRKYRMTFKGTAYAAGTKGDLRLVARAVHNPAFGVVSVSNLRRRLLDVFSYIKHPDKALESVMYW